MSADCTCENGHDFRCPVHGIEKQARPKSKKSGSKKAPGSSLRYKSPNKMEEDELQAFIKACLMYAQEIIEGQTSCWYCGAATTELDLHHIHRRGQGGRTEIRNSALACRSCHQREDGNVLIWSKSA